MYLLNFSPTHIIRCAVLILILVNFYDNAALEISRQLIAFLISDELNRFDVSAAVTHRCRVCIQQQRGAYLFRRKS